MKKRRSLKEIFSDAWRLFLNDIKSAKWAIAVIIACFVLLRNILYSMCPMVVLTGLPCPGCGLTRAGFSVLRMDFCGAWRIHPFIFPIILLIILFCFNRYIFMKKRMPLLKWCMVFLMSSMILFYIWRMLKFFPGEPPMGYYQYNVLSRLIHLLQ